jgi:4-amino-4-deoxy-L-arabinose transferase-like glycosyltransferase
LIQRAAIWLILIVYLALGVLYAIRTPDWQAPDEPAHYNYVAQVSANGCCPVIEVGDWDSAYLEELKNARFAPELLGELPAIQYEDHQPPLYYLIGSVVFRLTNGSLLALRLMSVVFGAGAILCAYWIGRALFADRIGVALGAAAFVAFIPQRIAMMSAVNNDGLAELIIGAALLGFVIYAQGGRVKAWHLGVIAAIGLLTKVSTIFLVGLIPLGIVGKWWFERKGGGEKQPSSFNGVLELILFAVPVLIIGGVWLARNAGVYGFPDVLGLGAHNIAVADQQRTADLVTQIGFGAYLQRAWETTFNSFFGQLGWMGYPLPGWCYALILIMLAVALIGWIVSLFPLPSPDRTPRPFYVPELIAGRKLIHIIITVAALLALAQYVYYNLEFLQHQGRYLYPGLISLALWLALGVDAWGRLLGMALAAEHSEGETSSAAERRWAYLLNFAAPAVFAALIPINVFVIWRILPLLAP